VAGCAKGAGMIEPKMATMLAFIVTDAAVNAPELKRTLKRALPSSFNAITVDGDMSTNDTLLLMASGAAGATRTLGQTEALLIEVNYTQHYNRAVAFDELHAFLNMAGFHLYGISAPYGNAERPLWADAMYVHSIEPKVSDSN